MNEKEHDVAIKGLIYNLSAITGIKIPDDPVYLKCLQYQIKECFAENEKFAQCTYDEIITAARFNVSGNLKEKVQHWQNDFNVGYLSEILLKWIDHKMEVENRIDRELMTVNVCEVDTREDYDDDQALQHAIDNWSRTKDYMYIESRVFFILEHRGDIKLPIDDKDRIMKQATKKAERIHRRYNTIITFENIDGATKMIARKISVAEFLNAGPVDDVEYEYQRKQPVFNFDAL